MPNQEHLDILLRGVEVWNHWIAESPEKIPNLGGADLSGAILCRANLRYAVLNYADLRSAVLNNADLSVADLTGANLTGANLTGAILHQADLNNADLSRAIIGYTTFGDNDLSVVNGLETLKHLRPSTIGIDTIYRSNGNIPEVFLRGTGIPDTFITYMRSLTADPLDFYSCFISYSHADKSFARRLHDALQGRGIRCWRDEHQILVGDDLYKEVDKGIRLWDKVLLCASKHSLISWWVDREIDTAIEKEQQLRKEKGKEILALVPLNLDGFMFSPEWRSPHAATLRKRLAPDFTGWEQDDANFEEQFERVVKALRAGAGAREPPPAPKL